MECVSLAYFHHACALPHDTVETAGAVSLVMNCRRGNSLEISDDTRRQERTLAVIETASKLCQSF